MAGFNVAVGMYESVFNQVLSQIYAAIYPYLLSNISIDVNEAGFSTIQIDVKTTPTVTLQPSDEANAKIATIVDSFLQQNNVVDLPPSYKSALTAAATSATFIANFPDFMLHINYADGTPATTIDSASLVAHATVSTNGPDSELGFQLLTGAINIPDNRILNGLLNNALLLYLIEYLNDKILSPIKIPMLGINSLHVSVPRPVVEQSYFIAYSDLVPSTSLTSIATNPLPWPKDGIFIAADIPTLQAAAGIVFPLGPSEGFNWEIFSGNVSAQVNLPTISSISADGFISATITADARCQLTMKTPPFVPNITFGPSATAEAAATLTASVANNEVSLVLQGTPSLNFSFDWGIPGSINWFFTPYEAALEVALNDVLLPIIASKLDGVNIPIYEIPKVSIDYGGSNSINIQLDSAKASGLNDNILVVTAVATASN